MIHLHFPALLFPLIKKGVITSTNITGGSFKNGGEQLLEEFWHLEVTLQPYALNMLRALDFTALWRAYLISSAYEELY